MPPQCRKPPVFLARLQVGTHISMTALIEFDAKSSSRAPCSERLHRLHYRGLISCVRSATCVPAPLHIEHGRWEGEPDVSKSSAAYSTAAAVGSLSSCRISTPAMAAASMIACRWRCVKQAGTVNTAFRRSPSCSFRCSWERSRIRDWGMDKLHAELCEGADNWCVAEYNLCCKLDMSQKHCIKLLCQKCSWLLAKVHCRQAGRHPAELSIFFESAAVSATRLAKHLRPAAFRPRCK